jgi:uncharacterized protein YycO
MKYLINFLNYLRFPFFRKKSFYSDTYRSVIDIVKPGDLIFTKSGGFLLNLLNPSKKYKHVGIVVSNINANVHIVEATGDGVIRSHLFDFLKEKTIMGVYRNMVTSDMHNVVRIAMDHVGRPYDYSFEPGNKKYYCFELAAYAYEAIPSIIIKKQRVLWDYRYLAQSFVNSVQFKLMGEFSVED